MRIISGRLKGRRFYPPKNLPYRPTTDFAKTGLFNILNNNFDFEQIKVLDLFAGTGNISFEFASRGCQDITSVDINQGCINFIQTTAEKFSIPFIKAYQANVFSFLNSHDEQFDIIFAGPPYALENIDTIPGKIIDKKLLKKEGWFILEHFNKLSLDKLPNFIHKRPYGTTIFSIFTP